MWGSVIFKRVGQKGSCKLCTHFRRVKPADGFGVHAAGQCQLQKSGLFFEGSMAGALLFLLKRSHNLCREPAVGMRVVGALLHVCSRFMHDTC